MLNIKTKLGLNGSTVYAIAMKTFPGAPRQLHVLLSAMCVDREGDLEMHACDDLCIGKLPDVNMMAADNSGKLFNVLADLWDADILRSGLEQDTRSSKSQRNGCLKNNGCNDERDCRVSIELARPVGEPYDECC